MGDLVKEPTLLLGDNKRASRWAREDTITNGNGFIERMYFKVSSKAPRLGMWSTLPTLRFRAL